LDPATLDRVDGHGQDGADRAADLIRANLLVTCFEALPELGHGSPVSDLELL